MGDLAALRRIMRARRRAVSTSARNDKSVQAARHLLDRLPATAQRIAVYLSLPEEIDTAPLIRGLWQRGIHTYLPYTIARAAALQFLPYDPHTALATDTLGIAAPRWQAEAACDGANLDLIIVPLVAWDMQGNRIGMGGGYYDRTFAAPVRPPLWGIAYDCQRADNIDAAPWDIKLDALISESGWRAFPK